MADNEPIKNKIKNLRAQIKLGKQDGSIPSGRNPYAKSSIPEGFKSLNLFKNYIVDKSSAIYNSLPKTDKTLSFWTKDLWVKLLENKLLVFIISILIVFLVMSGLIISNDYESVNAMLGWYSSDGDLIDETTFSGKSGVIAWWVLFFGTLFISLVLILILSYRKNIDKNGETWNTRDELKYVTEKYGYDGFFIFIALFVVIFYYSYGHLNNQYPDIMGAINSTLIVFMFIGAISLFIVFMRGNLKNIRENIIDYDDSPTLLNIIKRFLFFIPCLFIDFAEYIYKEYKITPSPTFVLLSMELLLLAIYFIMPNVQKIYNDMILHDGQDLVTERMYLRSETTLDVNTKSFQDKNKNSSETSAIDSSVSYNYALSSWVYFMDSRGSNSYKTVVNYGNKPIIEYNDKTHMLRIMCKIWDTENNLDSDGNPTLQITKEIYKTSDIPLQSWNHLLFNFSGGVLDIFINSKLVASSNNVLPSDYESNDTVTIGDQIGVQGEITDVTYFSHELSKSSIRNIYKTNRGKVGNASKPWWKFV